MKQALLFLLPALVYGQSGGSTPGGGSGGGSGGGGNSAASATYTLGTTYYFSLAAGSLAAATTQSVVQTSYAKAGTMSSLSMVLNPAPTGVNTVTITLNDGSSAGNTPVTCTVTASVNPCADSTHSLAYAAGDRMSAVLTLSGASYTGTVVFTVGTGQPGPQGPQGNVGATGPQGPPGLPAIFNVQSAACGATGNGSTDDRLAIQTCINLAKANTPATVYFPPGTYFLGSTGTIAILQISDFSTQWTINFVFSGATLTTAQTNKPILYLGGCWQNSTISGGTWVNTHGITTVDTIGIQLGGGSANCSINNTISGATFQNMSRQVQFDGVNGLSITGNQFLMTNGRDSGSGSSGTPNVGVWMFNNTSTGGGTSSNVSVIGNVYNGCTSGNVTGNTQKTCGDGFVYGQGINAIVRKNSISRFSFEGVYLFPDTTNGTPALIADNNIDGTLVTGDTTGGGQWGIRDDNTGSTVSNNTITNCLNGILVYGPTYAAFINNVQISGNHIRTTAAQTQAIVEGIEATQVNGTVINNNDITWLGSPTTALVQSIRVEGVAATNGTNNTITNNSVTGNWTVAPATTECIYLQFLVPTSWGPIQANTCQNLPTGIHYQNVGTPTNTQLISLITNNAYIGVTGVLNPSITFPAPGTYGSVTLDSYGRITSAATGAPAGGGASWTPGPFGPCGLTSVCVLTHGFNTSAVVVPSMVDANGCYLSSGLNANSLGCNSQASVISVGKHASNPNNAIDVALSADISGTWSAVGPPSGPPTVAAPVFNNGTGTYNNTLSVSISDTTFGATICYTTDGTTPTATTPGTCTNGTVFSNPVTISRNGTVLQAIGTLSGYINSAVTGATYTLQVGSITTNPPTPYSGPTTNVTLVSQTTSAGLHYRTDGATASCTDTTYTTAIPVSVTTTITAIGCLNNFANSVGFSGTFTISNTVATPTDSPGQNTYTTSASVTLSDVTSGATICYTTNGNTPTAATAGTCDAGSGITTYSGSAFSITATSTVKAIGTKAGLTNSGVLTSVYTIQAAAPTDTPGQGSYGGTQNVTLSDTTSGVTICYTLDNSTPTISGATCTHGTTYGGTSFPISTTSTLKAIAGKVGISASGQLTSTYTITAASFINSVNLTTGMGSAVTLSGLSTNSGDTIVLVVGNVNGNCSTATLSVVGGGTDNFTLKQNVSASFSCINVYFMGQTSANSTYNIVMTPDSQFNGAESGVVAYQFRGYQGIVDQGPLSGSAVASSPIPSSGSAMTTTHASEAVIEAMHNYYTGGTVGASSGFILATNGSDDTGVTPGGVTSMIYQVVTSTNTYTPQITITGTVYSNWVAFSFY